jgi:DNA invertase Pin-like site-specific DNA recombinase
MKVAIYARVSTAEQNCDLQIREVTAYVGNLGWEIVEIYQDVMSGATAVRPGLSRLLEDARLKKFDCVLVWKLDRFGRSLVDCLNHIRILEEYRIRFVAVTQALDTDQQNPASRFLLHVLGAAAEFERQLIRERSVAGQRRYREQHKAGYAHSRSGKNLAIGRPKRVIDRRRVRELRDSGQKWSAIAKKLGVSIATVRRAYNSPADLPGTCQKPDF